MAASVGPFRPGFVFSGEKKILAENIFVVEKISGGKNFWWKKNVWQKKNFVKKIISCSWQGVVSRWQMAGDPTVWGL